MDPDCAICHAPAHEQCDCESKGLERAVKEAEERMMETVYDEIRQWARSHAQDYILDCFQQITEQRKNNHAARLEHINKQAAHYNMLPSPVDIASEHERLKRQIDEDWKVSVQRYPQVLDYFFSQVEFTIPNDQEASVKNPAIPVPGPSAGSHHGSSSREYRKSRRRSNSGSGLGRPHTTPPFGIDEPRPPHSHHSHHSLHSLRRNSVRHSQQPLSLPRYDEPYEDPRAPVPSVWSGSYPKPPSQTYYSQHHSSSHRGLPPY